jgi:3-oxoacyl-[acyl-carrier protein] reductase
MKVPANHRASFEGRVALVTGGGGGIGSAACAMLLDAGARVFSADHDDRPGPEGTVSLACDVSRAAEVAAAMAAVRSAAGRLDCVVHCAGVTRDALIARMTDDDWHVVVSTNLDSAFYLVRDAAPALREAGGGAIVLVSSINADRGKVGQANYAASKAGLHGLARTAARELGRFNIRVNVVAPGWIDTRMTAGLAAELRARAVNETALGRVGRPEDVAAAILFLCSDASAHVTGQVLRVDGGQLTG